MGDINIQELQKVFGNGDGNDIVAVDNLDLSIEDGEFIVFVGPSGCGKSTTLRCIAGLETVTSGSITLDGEEIVDKSPQKRDIAMVFQNYALYPHMTSRRNMSFGLEMSTNLSDEEIAERVEQAASMMGIEDLLNKKPGELSGGQQQRVALGRAIVRDPKVFLMDEPLSNLDAKLRTEMRTELQSLQEGLDVTTIYVTHDQTEAMTMGDRIVVLDDGELQQVGTPLECYHTPANRFVAGFIGSPSMNFFDVEFDADASQLVGDAFDYDVSAETTEILSDANNSLTLGIRPEDIRLADAADRNAVPVEIDVVEPLGDQTFLYFELGGQTRTASVSGERYIKEGQSIDVVFPESKIHVFDGRNGDAIKSRELPDEADVSMGKTAASDPTSTAD